MAHKSTCVTGNGNDQWFGTPSPVNPDSEWICNECGAVIPTGEAGTPQDLPPQPKKKVFSGTQKAGVAAAIIVSPWFWPVALFPSLVRKTAQIVRDSGSTNDNRTTLPITATSTISETNPKIRMGGLICLVLVIAFLWHLGSVAVGFIGGETSTISPVSSAHPSDHFMSEADIENAKNDARRRANR